MNRVRRQGKAAPAFWKAIRSQSGAFDLPSILVGVVVVGILAAGVLAAVFAVIPFAQDNAAKQDLDAVRTAEGVAKSRLDGFKDKPGLLSNNLIGDSATIGVASDPAGTCYVGLSKSATGKVYIATDRDTEPQPLYQTAPDTDCLNAEELAPIIDDLGGLPNSPGGTTPGGTTPGGTTPGGSTPGGPIVTPTAYDFDGDRVVNAFDPSPRGETSQHLAGFGGNWTYELGTTNDTLSTTDYILQGPLAGQRIGLLSENTGSTNACGTLESSGELYCWGYNNYGQLGLGTNTYQESAPGKVIGLEGKVISQVVTGGYGTCAIADGTPWCWGGEGVVPNPGSSTPLAVDVSALGGKAITKLIAGNQYACVLADSAPYCWGYNTRGILGNGTIGSASSSAAAVPVNTTGALAGKTITDLFAGNSNACVTVSEGGAYCWGGNSDAQIGDGTRTDRSVPTAVQGLGGKTVTSIAGGYSNTCAVADGAAYCWGNRTGNWYNMIGDGVKQSYGYDPVTYEGLPSNFHMAAVPVDATGALAGKTVSHVDMGDSHVCVIASEQPFCWGSWESEDPGNDGYGYIETFSPVAVGSTFAAGNKTVGLWTTGGSTIFSYIKTS